MPVKRFPMLGMDPELAQAAVARLPNLLALFTKAPMSPLIRLAASMAVCAIAKLLTTPEARVFEDTEDCDKSTDDKFVPIPSMFKAFND